MPQAERFKTANGCYWKYLDGPCVTSKFSPSMVNIVNKEYKLVRFYYDVDEWELYDRLNDPNEMNNVYNDPNYSEVVKDLKVKLAELRVKYNDSEELDKKYMY